jgi:hypothetical protein
MLFSISFTTSLLPSKMSAYHRGSTTNGHLKRVPLMSAQAGNTPTGNALQTKMMIHPIMITIDLVQLIILQIKLPTSPPFGNVGFIGNH